MKGVQIYLPFFTTQIPTGSACWSECTFFVQ